MSVRPRTDADVPALVEALSGTHRADAYPWMWPADPADFLAPPLTVGAWVAGAGGVPVGQVVLRLGRRAILDVQTGAPAPIALYESGGWARVTTLPAPWTGADGRHPQIYVYVSPA